MDDAPQWTTLWQLADLFIEDRGDGSARIRRGDWSEWVIIDRVEMQWVLDRLAEAQARGGNTG